MRASVNHRQRGAALIEFALCASLLLLLLFGILDVGLLVGDRAALGEVARDAARCAAVGDPPSVAAQQAIASTTLQVTTADITLQRSTPDSNGDPTTWVSLGSLAGAEGSTLNDAATGDFVQATVTYDHPLISSLVFNGGTFPLQASLIMRREAAQ